MQRLLAFILATLVVVPLAGQAPSDFAGRWRIVTPTPSSGTPTEILFTGPTASQLFIVERHLATGVVSAGYSLIPSRLGMASEARWAGKTLRLLQPGNGGVGAAPPTPDHEETWTIAPDGALLVSVSDHIPRGATATSQQTYRRIPIPASVRAGENLLDNPNADTAGRDWIAGRDAKVDACDGNPCFVVRNAGVFQQTVLLPTDAAGKFIVMIGSLASERIDADRGITGLPYLYGMVAIADGSRYLGYLQGMHAITATPNAWVTTSGVFPIPVGAARGTFQLKQASARGFEQNGSAARFDDLGCYIFPTEAEARAFVAEWRGRARR